MISSGRFPHLADAKAVEQWSERVEARTAFPQLVRRLIYRTNDQVTSLQMRAGEGGGLSGYDGVVEASRGTPFVPHGLSVWELGVGDPPGAKGNKDYRSRTDEPLGVDRSKTTFVFVTARRWPGKTAWAEAKRNEHEWAGVWALDADDIETAFEAAPEVQFWFSELIGLPVDGVRTIESWWEAFSRGSQPVLTPELVLAGRADAAAELLRLVDADTRITTVAAASADDVLAFVAATIMSSTEPVRSNLLARTLVVHDAATLRRLDGTTDLLVLLPFEDELRREAQLVRSHHVIVLATDGVPSDVDVPRIERAAFASALIGSGVGDEDAHQLARAAHRSVVAFQMESPGRGTPLRGWSASFGSRIVRRAWLAGGWQEARSGDTDALVALFVTAYDDARTELDPCASGEDPIFAVVGGTWALVSPEQAWSFGHAHLTGSDLAALEQMVQTVLGAIDPAVELPAEERWLAGIRGKTRVHSSDLRSGLAVTLAVFGAFGHGKRVGAVATPATWAAGVVARLLRRANEDRSGHLWSSLSDVLPLLAEAAPDAFLRAVQEGVTERSEPVLATIFVDQAGDSFSVSAPHTGMLWALEVLAWSDEHAALAIHLLACLAELDPDGRLSNRPRNSLADIFRTWLPQTSLPMKRRLDVLDAVRRGHPEVAWELMLTLLPEHHAVGNYTQAPRFRDWKPESEGVSPREYWEVSSGVARRVLEDAAVSPHRWPQLVDRLPDFPPPERSAALERLEELGTSSELGASLRDRVWNELDKLVRQHRKFADADWSLQGDELERISQVAARFTPNDAADAHAWLFDEHYPDLGTARESLDVEQERLRGARVEAVEKVLAADGVDGLIAFAGRVGFPGFLGEAAGRRATDELDELAMELLDDNNPKLSQLAYGYSHQRLRDMGMDWLRVQVDRAASRPLAQARLLQVSYDLETVWPLATELGPEVEEAYWREFSPFGHGADFSLANEAATQLLRFDRVMTALALMGLYVRKDDRRVSAALIAEALERLVALPADQVESTRLTGYELNELLDYVRDSDIGDDRLALLEWRLLPALGYAARSPVLERKLAQDPAFFVEIVSLIYKPRGEVPAESTPEAISRNAWQLLHDWRIVPGSSEDGGQIDSAALGSWVNEARRLLAEAKRLEVGDIHIGHVLSRARGDEDGTWPTRPVRDLIERVRSPEIEDGLGTQAYNDRGVTSRGLTDGGGQERALADKYSGLADRIKDDSPRTAAVLRSLARSYESDAQRNDDEAERFRAGIDR